MTKESLSTNGTSRRVFMTSSLTGIAAAAVVPSQLIAANSSSKNLPSAKTLPQYSTAFDPRSKLKTISSRAKQLWTVVYVERLKTKETVERDVEASLEGGADAVVLELGRDPDILSTALAHVRSKYPQAKVGVNYLGGDEDPYGYLTGFLLAKKLDLHIVWTDFCGVDLVKELPPISLHEIESKKSPTAFYCSGIHMKYGTMLDPSKTIEKSALQAMGWVDGIVITGPKTGIPTDPERAKRVRQTVGDYPMGTASGVSAENFHTIRDAVDYCLVNTSISDLEHRIIATKVKALRQVMI
jgi:hypothetical protein